MLENTRNKTRRKLIDLYSMEDNVKEVMGLHDTLYSRLKEDGLFQISDFDELIYRALKFIKPINRKVKPNRASIERGILEVITYFGLNKSAIGKISRLSSKGEFVPEKGIKEKQKDSPRDIFKRHVLGLDKLPSTQLIALKNAVEKDLKEINDLVIKYEKHPEITKYINRGHVKKDHNTRSIIDFYNRTIRERHNILTYYLNGIYDRALEKSRHKWWNMGYFYLGELSRDFPYEFKQRFKFKNFDYDKIDQVSHRIDGLSSSELSSYSDLYFRNKSKFYKNLFKRKSKLQSLTNIEWYSHFLPISDERKKVFQELKILFQSKKWLAFYALALPQVEGIFSEMLSIIKPKPSNLYKALPDKVNMVRPNYLYSNFYLDYYQYILPEKRNKFMHTGLAEDYNLNAYDMLTDLEHVLKIYYELNHPFVELTKILKRRDSKEFIDYKGFSRYFSLLAKIGVQEKKELEKDLESFHLDFLLKDCQVEYIVFEAARDINIKTLEVSNNINMELGLDKIYGVEKYLTESDIQKIFKQPKFSKKFRHFAIVNSEKIKDLYVLKDFFLGVSKHLKMLTRNSEIKNYLKSWEEKKKIVFNLEKMELELSTII